jgi:hypothetical protein
MAYREMESIRSKTDIMTGYWNKLIYFYYFGYNTFYEGEKDLNVKIMNAVKLATYMNQIFTVISF